MDHPLAREKTFGPLAFGLRAPEIRAAVAIAVPYGLITSIHGRDLRQVLAAVDGVDTGLVKVNGPCYRGRFLCPVRWEKASSYGPREQGQAALGVLRHHRTVTLVPG